MNYTTEEALVRNLNSLNSNMTNLIEEVRAVKNAILVLADFCKDVKISQTIKIEDYLRSPKITN